MYGQYKDRLYRYALYKLCNPTLAEDAVSECVLAAWKDIGKLRSSDAFGAWIFAILRNICAGQIRRLVADRDHIDQSISDGSAEVSDVPDGSDDSNAYGVSAPGASGSALTRTQQSIELAEALETLKDDEREIVLMSVISGLNSKEISEITGLAPGAVRSKLSRSLAKMRSFLEAQ